MGESSWVIREKAARREVIRVEKEKLLQTIEAQYNKEKKDYIKNSPIVVLMGRGGSGTRMLSYLAEDLGYFLGNRLNKSKDSTEWTKFFFEIVDHYGHRPELPIDGSKFEERFLQIANEILYKGEYPEKWGWKIPHTILFFPIIADIFPNSKFVHIIRHPFPSVLGSKTRKADKTSRIEGQGGYLLPAAHEYITGVRLERDIFKKQYMGKKEPRISSQLDHSLETQFAFNAISWVHQIDRAIEYGRKELGNDRYLELTYEEICEDPIKALNKMAIFLGEPKQEKTSLEILKIEKGKWTKKQKKEAWKFCRKTAKKAGYKNKEERGIVPRN